MKYLITLCIFLYGCAPKYTPAPTQENPKPVAIYVPINKEQVIKALNEKTKAMGLKWDDECVPVFEGEKDQYIAGAYKKGASEIDQSSDRWLEEGDTQLEAAQKLLVALDGLPTHPAHSEVTAEHRLKKQICEKWGGGAK